MNTVRVHAGYAKCSMLANKLKLQAHPGKCGEPVSNRQG